MAKKAKVEEVKVEEVKAPLTWTVSDDMMSITLPVKRPDEGTIEMVLLGLIDESPYQVRTVDVESDSFKELVESVKANGLINPITLRFIEETGRYQLIAGHRRKRACEVAGLIQAPSYLLKVSDKKAEDMTCCENLNREDLLPIDEALTVKAMLDHGRTRDEIAEITGKSTRWVYRREAAGRLEAVWVEKAKKHKLSSKFLEMLASIDAGTREAMTQENDFLEDNLSIFDDGGDIDQLEWDAGMRRRKVEYAPWMKLFPQDCTDCKKRTDTNEVVADELSDSQCLDAECWKRNLDSYGDRAEAHYKEQGIDVRRVKKEDAWQMDLEDDQTEEYDVCILVVDDDNIDIQWGRSKPRSEKLSKNAKELKPTEQNIFEKAYAEEVMERIENSVSGAHDYPNDLMAFKRLTAASISCGMEMVEPKMAQSWQSPNRAGYCTSWLMDNGCDSDYILQALAKCVLSGAVSKLRIYNPRDTSSTYIYAQAYVMAFEMVPSEVEAAARKRMPKAKKAKSK